jgi:hypothetical protein
MNFSRKPSVGLLEARFDECRCEARNLLKDLMVGEFSEIDLIAYSDAVGHLFRFLSDTIPGLPDSFRSEATLWMQS